MLSKLEPPEKEKLCALISDVILLGVVHKAETIEFLLTQFLESLECKSFSREFVADVRKTALTMLCNYTRLAELQDKINSCMVKKP